MRIAAALVLMASSAAAEPAASATPSQMPSFSFVWDAPASCPTRAWVLGRAEALVGHPLTRAAGAEPLELAATVRVADVSWQLHVSSGSGAKGERAMGASSCEELAEAMALLIALSLDPDAARSGAVALPQQPTSAAAGSAADGVGAESAPPTPAPASNAREPAAPALNARSAARSAADPRILADLGALAALGSGRLPGLAPGALLYGALSWRRMMVGLELGWFPARHAAIASAGADLWLVSAAGELGYSWFNGLLSPYVGLELDRVHGVGTDLDTSHSGNLWLLALDLGLRVRYPVQRPLRLVVQCEASALTERGRFHIDPNTELFRPARLGLQFGFGAELRVQ